LQDMTNMRLTCFWSFT